MKQTEIGNSIADDAIPEDWEVKTVKEFAAISTGNKNTQDADPNGIYPFYVRSPIIEKINSFTFDTEGVITAGDGVGTGKVFHYVDGKFGLHQRAYLIHDFSNVSAKYFYWIFSKNFYSRVHAMTAKTSVDSVRKEMIADMLIPLPPLPEQRRIAQALSDVDSLITTLEKLVAKKTRVKQGAMSLLLSGKVKIENGTFAKCTRFKQTELGEIPADWEVKTLGEVFDFYPNNTYSRDCLNYSGGEYQNIHYGDILIKFPSVLNCQSVEIPYINEGIRVNFAKYGVQNGDVIIADTAEDETCGKVTEIKNLGDKKIVSGLHTILCRPKNDEFSSGWLGYFMNYSLYHDQLLPLITGIKVSSISKTNILSTMIAIPTLAEQSAIAAVLSDMDAEITALDAKLAKYRQLKTAMMQQLLTGKIRLMEKEVFACEDM
ncbi:MAG: restriction endonuclease subunit S [Treponema sp.]|nr:restriction endonuclease subunit S [Treponema sp.]